MTTYVDHFFVVAASTSPPCEQCLYDLCLVWPSENKGIALWQAILVSWGIAFFEYLIMEPANRWGSSLYTPYQLKIIQEVITLTVFAIFAFFYFGTKP